MSPVPLWTRGCLTDLTLGRAPVVTPPGGWLPSVVVPWATASCVRTASANVPRMFSSTLMGCDPPLSQERAEYVVAYRRCIGYDGSRRQRQGPSWSRPTQGGSLRVRGKIRVLWIGPLAGTLLRFALVGTPRWAISQHRRSSRCHLCLKISKRQILCFHQFDVAPRLVTLRRVVRHAGSRQSVLTIRCRSHDAESTVAVSKPWDAPHEPP